MLFRSLFQLDGDLRIVRYHAASESDLTMPPESFLGRRLDEVLSADTARRFGGAALAAARSGRIQRIEYSSARHGSRRHFEARLGAIPTGGTLLVLRDVTELKDAELALRESEARWQFALDGAGDGVWDWSIATGRVFRSKRWLTMLGFEPGELPEDTDAWASRVHPEDLPGALAAEDEHLHHHSHTATGSPSVIMGVTSKSQNAVQVPNTTRAMLSCPARRGLASTHAQPAYAIQKVVKYCT